MYALPTHHFDLIHEHIPLVDPQTTRFEAQITDVWFLSLHVSSLKTQVTQDLHEKSAVKQLNS